MKAKISLCGAVMVSLLVPVLGFAQTKGDPNAGKMTYGKQCVGCHGTAGKGDGPAAAALNPKPKDHSDGKIMNSVSDKDLFGIIKGGGASVKKSPIMPAAGKALTDQDIWNVVAYIRSLAKPPYKAGK